MPELSTRSLRNIEVNESWALLMKVWGNPYSPDENPAGIVSMGVAENKLMHTEIRDYLNKNMSITSKMLTYGDGPSGSFELRKALATFVNKHFNPNDAISFNQITVMNGVGSVIDALCFCLANPGDGMLIMRPLYVGFPRDLKERSEVLPIFVSVGTKDVMGLEAVKAHEVALLDARKSGITVNALILCNPHNPLGRCYPRDVLEAYLKLCSKHNIHLISDEVYAKAVYPSKDVPNPVPFTSILALPLSKYIDPGLVHVLYGMSKDFSSNGLRIGALISPQNPTLHTTMNSIAAFSWASSLSDHAWTLLLTDTPFLDEYFSTMQNKLTTAYELCTDALKEMGIAYIPANCGPFIWLDLNKFMEESTWEEESKLAYRMLDAGVWLATGKLFMSEVPGWFRITFAVPEEDFVHGLGRLKKTLLFDKVEVKAVGPKQKKLYRSLL